MPTEIDADTASLVEIIDLLRTERPLTDWPVAAQAVLAQALDDGHRNHAESAKAVRLRRHLFGDLPVPTFVSGEAPERRAERVRADLADLVAFGSGFYLVDPVALAHTWTARRLP